MSPRTQGSDPGLWGAGDPGAWGFAPSSSNKAAPEGAATQEEAGCGNTILSLLLMCIFPPGNVFLTKKMESQMYVFLFRELGRR